MYEYFNYIKAVVAAAAAAVGVVNRHIFFFTVDHPASRVESSRVESGLGLY